MSNAAASVPGRAARLAPVIAPSPRRDDDAPSRPGIDRRTALTSVLLAGGALAGGAALAGCTTPEDRADDPQAVAAHLQWHLQRHGVDLSAGPAPADIVLALRDRVQTLAEMAERATVWFRPLTDYDDAAVAKHLGEAARAPLADAPGDVNADPMMAWFFAITPKDGIDLDGFMDEDAYKALIG